MKNNTSHVPVGKPLIDLELKGQESGEKSPFLIDTPSPFTTPIVFEGFQKIIDSLSVAGKIVLGGFTPQDEVKFESKERHELQERIMILMEEVQEKNPHNFNEIMEELRIVERVNIHLGKNNVGLSGKTQKLLDEASTLLTKGDEYTRERISKETEIALSFREDALRAERNGLPADNDWAGCRVHTVKAFLEAYKLSIHPGGLDQYDLVDSRRKFENGEKQFNLFDSLKSLLTNKEQTVDAKNMEAVLEPKTMPQAGSQRKEEKSFQAPSVPEKTGVNKEQVKHALSLTSGILPGLWARRSSAALDAYKGAKNILKEAQSSEILDGDSEGRKLKADAMKVIEIESSSSQENSSGSPENTGSGQTDSIPTRVVSFFVEAGKKELEKVEEQYQKDKDTISEVIFFGN